MTKELPGQNYIIYILKTIKILPLLPLFGYYAEIQMISRGSIFKNAAPLLPHATPQENQGVAFEYRQTVV